MRYYNKSIYDVLKYLSVNGQVGLDENEVKRRRLKYGKNEFTIEESSSFLDELGKSLTKPMILILLGTAILSSFAGKLHDAFGIIGAIMLSILIRIIIKRRSKKAAQALSNLTDDIIVKVLRNGKLKTLNKSELVVGDIVNIETGDMIPCDGRLIKSSNLKLRENMLTGQSNDVVKVANSSVNTEIINTSIGTIEQDAICAKQINMVFGGTFVVYGRGVMVVTSIGDNTEMGKILYKNI